MNVLDAMAGRYSARTFEPRLPDRPAIEAILRNAGRAPSRHNIQPWSVRVFRGDALADLVNIASAVERPLIGPGDTDAYAGQDKDGAFRRHALRFFEAPVGVLCAMPRGVSQGLLMDHGCFIYGIELAAAAFGLNACIVGEFAGLDDELADISKFDPSVEQLTCGVGIGYGEFRPRNLANRRPLDEFAQFKWD